MGGGLHAKDSGRHWGSAVTMGDTRGWAPETVVFDLFTYYSVLFWVLPFSQVYFVVLWKRHEKIHTGEKPFACSKCDQSFADSGTLKEHERIHKGKRPFTCLKCDKTFSKSGTLKEHERIHNEKRAFACSKCDQSFTDSGTLKTSWEDPHRRKAICLFQMWPVICR